MNEEPGAAYEAKAPRPLHWAESHRDRLIEHGRGELQPQLWSSGSIVEAAAMIGIKRQQLKTGTRTKVMPKRYSGRG
jgi:hypothetical protein